MRKLIPAACAALMLAAPTWAQRNQVLTEPYAIQGVRLALDEDAPKHTLLIRAGRIESILPADREFSAEYRVLDGDGLVAVPAFIDAYTHAGIEVPKPDINRDAPLNTGKDVRVEMRWASRKGLQPAWSASDAWKMDAKGSEEQLKNGFGAILSAPHSEILSGSSVLAIMNGAPQRDAILKANVFGHAAFRASGDGYPSTLMGYHAQLRQFLMDTAWQEQLATRRAAGLPAPRASFDPDFQAARLLLAGERRLVCEAESARDIHRWVQLADEFGFQIAIAGGREAWKASALLADRNIPVILTLDWPDEAKDPNAKDKKNKKKGKDEEGEEVEPDGPIEDEPLVDAPELVDGPVSDVAEQDMEVQVIDVEDHDETEEEFDESVEESSSKEEADPYLYEEPKALQEERRRRWELFRDNAEALHGAGVEVYFGSGSDSTSRLMKRLRVLAENGFDRDHLIQRLSEDTATWLNAKSDLGALSEGRAATFCLWTDDPFAEKAQVQYAFVDGVLTKFEVKAAKTGSKGGGDAEGTWIVDAGEGGEIVMTLQVESDGTITGTWTGDDQPTPQPISGAIKDGKLNMTTEVSMGALSVEVLIEATVDGDALKGTAVSQDPVFELNMSFNGKRKPELSMHWHFDFTSDSPFEPASKHQCCDVEEPR